MSDLEIARLGGTAAITATRERVLRAWYNKKRERIAKLRTHAQVFEHALVIDVRAKAAWAKFAGPKDRISYEKFEEVIWELMQQGVVQ